MEEIKLVVAEKNFYQDASIMIAVSGKFEKSKF